MARNTLLITGFAPFDGQSINPSWEAVARLPDRLGPWQLEKRLLPVEYGRAAELALAAAERLQPEVILCIGQAGGRSAITPEVIGINLRDAAIADNAGVLHQGSPILPEGPDGCFSTVPVREMTAAISAAGIPGKLSCSAGAFVCNDVFYTLLAHYRGSRVRAGFIHVPWLPQQGNPSLTLEEILLGLEKAICAIAPLT